eukprot:12135412-Ditylum_brightwellii.AAC.1
MQLRIDSNAAYLVMPSTKSCFTSYFYLASMPHSLNYNIAPYNAPILVDCCALKNIVCSTVEAEYGGLFHNAQLAVIIHAILQAIGHPQGPTKNKTDSSTANSFVHASIRTKRSKTWDMRYHFLREKAVRKALDIYGDCGDNNDADYVTKHHFPTYHKQKRQYYVLKGFHATESQQACSNPTPRQGCVYPLCIPTYVDNHYS